MEIKVFTDACSNLFKEFLVKRSLDITVLPMELRIDDKIYECYADDMDVAQFSKEFYMEMRAGKRPKTSLVNPQKFSEAVYKEIAQGNKVIYISMSKNISGSFQAAHLMAQDINEEAGSEVVKLIDSKTAGFGEGMVAIKCAQYIQEGMEFEEVILKTTEYVERVRSEFTVEDLKYLTTSGRISKLLAKIGNLLSIKPMLYGSMEGKIESTAKVHGRNKAIRALANQVIKYIQDPNDMVYISHCDSEADAEKLKLLLAESNIKNVEVYFYDLISGSHVGPGTLAVFYEGKNRELK